MFTLKKVQYLAGMSQETLTRSVVTVNRVNYPPRLKPDAPLWRAEQ